MVDGRHLERRLLALPGSLPLGYHRLEVMGDALPGGPGVATLIVAPQQAYLPEQLQRGPGIWGFGLQLYGLQGLESWGLGDFGDLSGFATEVASLGAGVLGLNPLHALFPGNPAHASPYSPSSRCFLNPLYIDVEAVPDLVECPKRAASSATPRFVTSLAGASQCAARRLWSRAAAVKLPMLEQTLFGVPRQSSPTRDGARRGLPRSFSASMEQRLNVTRPLRRWPSISGPTSRGISLGAIGRRLTVIPIRRRRRHSRAIMRIA